MNDSGLHRPSRWPLIITAVGGVFAYFVITGGFGQDRQVANFWSFLPFFAFVLAASVLPVFLNFVQTGPDEVVVRNFMATRRIPVADIISLGMKHANKGQYLQITYQAGEKTVAYKFWNYYERTDVFDVIDEIRTYNGAVVLDKDLTYFTEKVVEARNAGKPLTFIGYSRPAVSAEDVRKFWWVPLLAGAVIWMLLQTGLFDVIY